MEKIELDKIAYDDGYGLHKILELINSDSTLKDTFTGGMNTISRIINSSYAAYIKLNKKIIGFIMLVHNTYTNEYEVDMGILNKYQNKGYGTQALNLFKDVIVRNNVEVKIQVNKKNIPAIKSVLNNKFRLIKEDNIYNYYTIDLNKSKTIS